MTFPTDEDFTDVPQRIYTSWLKWKKEESLPRVRKQMLSVLENVAWDSSFFWNLLSYEPASEQFSKMQKELLLFMRWEVSEELLFLLAKEKRLLHPYDEKYWCPVSVTLLSKSLHLVSDYLLPVKKRCGDVASDVQQTLFKELMKLSHEAANSVKDIINHNGRMSSNCELSVRDIAFLAKPEAGSRVLVVNTEPISWVSIEDFSKATKTLFLEWYLIHEVVMVVHALASLIHWNSCQNTGEPIYSLKNMCEVVGIEESLLDNFVPHAIRAWMPLINDVSNF